MISDVEDYHLQQEVLDKLDSTYYKAVDDAILQAAAIDGMVAAWMTPTRSTGTRRSTPPSRRASRLVHRPGHDGGDGGRPRHHRLHVQGQPGRPGGHQGRGHHPERGRLPSDGETLDQVVAQMKGGAEGTSDKIEIYRPLPRRRPPRAPSPARRPPRRRRGYHQHHRRPEATDTSHLPPGGETKEYTLTRKNIEIPVTRPRSCRPEARRWPSSASSPSPRASAAALRAAVKTGHRGVDQVDAIILDLRSNGGGLLDQAVDVASIFIPEGQAHRQHRGAPLAQAGLRGHGRRLPGRPRSTC